MRPVNPTHLELSYFTEKFGLDGIPRNLDQKKLHSAFEQVHAGREILFNYLINLKTDFGIETQQEFFLAHHLYLQSITDNGSTGQSIFDPIGNEQSKADILLSKLGINISIIDIRNDLSSQPSPTGQGSLLDEFITSIEAEQAIVNQFSLAIKYTANRYEFISQNLALNQFEDFYSTAETALRRAIRNTDPQEDYKTIRSYLFTSMNRACRNLLNIAYEKQNTEMTEYDLPGQKIDELLEQAEILQVYDKLENQELIEEIFSHTINGRLGSQFSNLELEQISEWEVNDSLVEKLKNLKSGDYNTLEFIHRRRKLLQLYLDDRSTDFIAERLGITNTKIKQILKDIIDKSQKHFGTD